MGVKEAANLNVLLAVIDFATQALLVGIGFFLVFDVDTLTSNVELGVAPTWDQFFIAIPIAMLAYTGVETVSNLAEEVRDPPRNVPNAYKLIALAVFAIYFTLPAIALSALPVFEQDGEFVTKLGQSPEAVFRTTRCSASFRTSGFPKACCWTVWRSTSACSPRRSCSSRRTPA